MTTLLYCFLAALVGAVIVLGVIARGAINEMRHAFHYRDLQVSRVNDAEREKQAAINETLEVRRALADEQRLHRLLLARRDAKRIAPMDWADRFIGWIGSGYNARGNFPTCLSELNDDVKEFADAPTPTTGAS